ncbi:MAG: hydroxylamine reductase [Desulfobulbaceae bacterium]|nr:hydroxylamine reductase [Desulfobulbaceae bacterium]
MFCYQCEQAAKGTGCTIVGVCGKNHEVATLQDLLVHALQGLAIYAEEAGKYGISDAEANIFTCEALFATLTNVDFDPERFKGLIHRAVQLRQKLEKAVKGKGGEGKHPEPAAGFIPANSIEELVNQGELFGIKSYPAASEDILSLKHILLYGMKGVAAYADHANILGQQDEDIYAFLHRGLAAIARTERSAEHMYDMVMQCGKMNLRAMELLDAGNTGAYGQPTPTRVPLGAKKGKAILVSGHDLLDLERILKLSEGTGINVYTHGEMLPTHGYPQLKKYPHFYGHYGTAWQNQHKEFPDFPGPIVMTTNCLQKPREAYAGHIYTTGLVGWPGITHIADKDFSPVIDQALAMEGFTGDVDHGSVTTGFGRHAILGAVDKIIGAVKSNKIRHFFLVAGCDGARPGRNYYTQFVEQVPEDCLVLTLACGKFRFFDMKLGEIEGIPRLLDVGQCNDAYSAIKVAIALAEAFGCGVNDLPLSYIITWYEQKAVAILLTMLYLGLRDIRLGPTLPAFVSPNILRILVDKFNIQPISTPEEDLRAILGA